MSLFFQRLLAFWLCGRTIYVSQFPAVAGFVASPGWYRVECVVFCDDSGVELGLEFDDGSVEMYPLSALSLTLMPRRASAVRVGSSAMLRP
ncbi:MAG: hypothetical protein ACXWF8_01710 [Methylobacter sp.]